LDRPIHYLEHSCYLFKDFPLLYLNAAEHTNYLISDVSNWMDTALSNTIAHFGDHYRTSHNEWTCFLDPRQLFEEKRH